MAKQFLHGSDAVALFQEVGGKRMAEAVAGSVLRDARADDGELDRTLQYTCINVVAELPGVDGVYCSAGGREEVLPGPFTGRMGVLMGHGSWHGCSGEVIGMVLNEHAVNVCDMFFEEPGKASGEQRNPVFIPFAIAYEDQVVFEVDVLNSQGDAFGKAESGAIEKSCHDVLWSGEERKNFAHFRL